MRRLIIDLIGIWKEVYEKREKEWIKQQFVNILTESSVNQFLVLEEQQTWYG